MALPWFLRMATALIVGDPKDASREDTTSSSSKQRVRQSSVVNGKRPICLSSGSGFQLPLHYPRYKKEDYEKMEEWRVDALLREYGLTCDGCVEEKRKYAMGAFLWPQQL